jgi:phosphoglycerol transferase MdoB-like AlkP superfamily enzyme
MLGAKNVGSGMKKLAGAKIVRYILDIFYFCAYPAFTSRLLTNMSQLLTRRSWQAMLAAVLLFLLVLLISKSHVHSGSLSTLRFSQSGLSSPVAFNQTLGVSQRHNRMELN